MLKKDSSVPFITLSLLLGFSSIASAGTWSPSQAWGEQQASYAPDYGNTFMYEWFNTYYNRLVGVFWNLEDYNLTVE